MQSGAEVWHKRPLLEEGRFQGFVKCALQNGNIIIGDRRPCSGREETEGIDNGKKTPASSIMDTHSSLPWDEIKPWEMKVFNISVLLVQISLSFSLLHFQIAGKKA